MRLFDLNSPVLRTAFANCTRWCLALVWVALGAGCGAPTPNGTLHRYQFEEPHMGTLFTIKVYAVDEAAAVAGKDAALAKVARLDRMMTDYDPDSELMRLCQRPAGEPVHVSEELFAILQESQRVAELTDGAFDVTVGPVIRLWRRARRAGTLPTPEQLARARRSVGWRNLKLDAAAGTVTLQTAHMQLDLGGIAKGFAADQALAELRRHGLNRALVAASGDIAVGDPPPGQRGWRVEVGGLRNTGRATPRILLLANAAVSTSGDAEQFVEIGGKRYSHIVDPRTGIGLTERWQVSIVAPHAAQTDAFATAVSVLGKERGLRVVASQPGMGAMIATVGVEPEQVFMTREFKRRCVAESRDGPDVPAEKR